jgi:hypothetical protein
MDSIRIIRASAVEIFEVLADGWSYGGWVVGAAHVRDVDPAWPAVGSRLHHRVGPWPISLDDATQVLEMDRDRRLVLDARAWPVGAARVEVCLEPIDANRTRVRMSERLTAPPLLEWIPGAVQDLLIVPRNRQCLARLDDLAVHRVRGEHAAAS